MTDKSAANESDTSASLDADEQRLLDTALLESDQLLARSLYDDQRRRQWRVVWLSALLVGGVAMTILILGILGGWFSLAGQVSVEGSDADVEKAEALAAEGWQLWQQRNFLGAADKFKESTKFDPESADAWNGLGWSLFNGGQSIEGEKAFQKCVKLNPQHPAGLNGLGQIYYMWNELDKAEQYLKKAAPQAPAAWWGLARVYLIQEKFAEAKPWVEKIAAQNPEDEGVKQMVAAVEEEKLDDSLRSMIKPAGKPNSDRSSKAAEGKPSPEAEAALEDIRRTIICYDLSFDQVLADSLSKYDEGRMELFPTKSSWPKGLMVDQVRGQQRTSKVLSLGGAAKGYSEKSSGTFEFTEPLTAPVRVDSYQTLLFLDGIGKSGTVLIDSYALIYCHGDVQGIINSQSYSTTVIRGDVSGRLRNASYGHWVIYGKFTGNYEQESSGTLRILGGFDGEIKLAKRAKVYLGGRTPAAALEKIEGAGTIYLEESDLEPGKHKLGKLTVIVGNAAAEAQQEEAAQEVPWSKTDTGRGWAMFRQGKYRSAERLFRRAIEKDVDDLAALNGLGFSLLNQGKHAEAKPLFEEYLKVEMDAAGPMTGLARCLKAEGKTDEAIEVWEEVVASTTGATDAMYGLAHAYLEKGEYEKAVKYFKMLVDLTPNNAVLKNELKQAEAGLAKKE